MKKIVFGSMLFLCLMFLTHQSYADSNYQSYEEITMSTGELLSDFSSSDYKDYYKKVKKESFMDGVFIPSIKMSKFLI